MSHKSITEMPNSNIDINLLKRPIVHGAAERKRSAKSIKKESIRDKYKGEFPGERLTKQNVIEWYAEKKDETIEINSPQELNKYKKAFYKYYEGIDNKIERKVNARLKEKNKSDRDYILNLDAVVQLEDENRKQRYVKNYPRSIL